MFRDSWLFITFFISCPFFIYKIKRHIHMLQLNSYMNQRYLVWLRRNAERVLKNIDFLPLLLLALLYPFIAHQVAYIVFGVSALLLYLFREKPKAKKKLIYTARVKRLLVSVFTLSAIILWVLNKLQVGPFLFLLGFGLMQIVVFVLVLCGNILVIPVEKSIQYYYYRDAAKKMAGLSNLKVVGITGSYGKTSTKHIVEKILSQKFNVLMTPGSYNTTMGVVITIRKLLSPLHDIFIAEMGAKKAGDIREICRLVKPDYGILTTIGAQHLETFKTLANVQSTKYELIRSLPDGGIGILNFDDPHIVEGLDLYGNKQLSYVTYGIEQNEVTVKADDIQYSEAGTEFTVEYNQHEYKFTTRLLGKHNLYNLLAGISLGFALGMEYRAIYAGVREVTPIEHRLQLKREKDYTIIDDAYNANPVGAQMALEVLKLINGNKKILITPGMIELGSKEYELNKEFAKQAAQVCDYIILVGEKQTKPLRDGLREMDYPPEQYHIAANIFAAFRHLETVQEQNDIILIENDLTDDYNE
jgi:UDP-N-acetylmuramoyl-tripeptide--D-alanyl-D-alanine ligase